MTRCKAGLHEMTPENTKTRRDRTSVECRTCSNARKLGKNSRIDNLCRNKLHEMTPENTAQHTRSKRCRACRLATLHRSRDRVVQAKRFIPEDGFEALYGPIPAPVPDREWYDQVIVDRLVAGISAGRRPTRMEWGAVFENSDLSNPELGELVGISGHTVSWHRSEYERTKANA